MAFRSSVSREGGNIFFALHSFGLPLKKGKLNWSRVRDNFEKMDVIELVSLDSRFYLEVPYTLSLT